MINIPNIRSAGSGNFFLIAGPCVVENDTMPFAVAEQINEACERLQIPFVFKASYRKANRSRGDSFTGIGDVAALELIQAIGKKYNVPTVTDIHTAEEAGLAAQFVDVLQIPAFLCRQTDLLVAAAKTGKAVNIKKGQFASASSMLFAVDKVRNAGNDSIMLTERGTTFGYEDLVVDFRNIPLMQEFGVPVVVDITHSLQQPNSATGVTGGRPEMIETLGKAAVAAGADGIFLETHPNPAIAKSDGANMLQLDLLPDLLEKMVKIRRALI